MKKEKSVRNAERKAALIKTAKSMIFPLILCAIIVVGIIVIINYQGAPEEPEIIRTYGYEGGSEAIVLENDSLKLTMDPITTQFSLEVKSSGKIWYSNPPDAADDTLAMMQEKNNLQSPLLMSYSVMGGLEVKFNAYEHSVKNGVYEIETGEDFIKVKYSMGNLEREYVIPPVCKATDYEKWTGLMSNEDRVMVKRYYKLYDINDLGKKDNKEELLASYPILETEPIYVLRDGATAALKTKMESIFESIGYTMEDYTADKELNQQEGVSEKPVFNVSMVYRLEGDQLVVEIPFSELEFKEDYPIYTLTPLPYFGAGGKTEEGYLLVPEGGGALIDFNNGKISQNNYYANLYDWDMALSRDAVVHSTRIYYGAFGIANGQDSFLCLLEEGAPYASVQADVSGKSNSYNYANAIYSVCVREQYKMDSTLSNNAIYVFLEDLPNETLTQRYCFVDSGDYSDMAKEYRDYLKDKHGSYLALNDDAQTPVAVEIVGAVDKMRQVLGVPVSLPLELTTFEEAEDLLRELKKEGMENLSVKLTGWCNGGVQQKVLRKIKPISDLGGRKKLQALIDAASSMNVDIYLDGVTQYAYDSGILDGFFSYADAAKTLAKERAELFIYSDVTYSAREGTDSYWLLHADLAMEMAKNLADYAAKHSAGVSFRETGKNLSSDFYKKNPVSRQEVLNRQVEHLKSLDDAGQNVMINMGNDYAVPYCDMVTNMDLQGSEYTILDSYVPFYQLAIHGYVNYTGVAINLAGDAQEELLRSAEYGAGLQFSLMQESAFTLQKTLYTEYYGSEYEAWGDRMMEIYNRYNAELGHTYNQEMTGHELLTEELSCTTYQDGTRVYVNYGYADAVTPDGKTVPARDYMVVR